MLRSAGGWKCHIRCASPRFLQDNLSAYFSVEGNGLMKVPGQNLLMAAGLVTVGMALAGAGIYIGETDDAPGAALIGILLMVGSVALAIRIVRRKARHGSHR